MFVAQGRVSGNYSKNSMTETALEGDRKQLNTSVNGEILY